MKKRLLIQGLLKNYGKRAAIITSMLLTAMLMCSCASENKQQISPMANETRQITNTDQTDAGGTPEEKEIICRMRAVTGSRFKHRVCATKAQWAKLENKNQADTDEFGREIGKQDGLNMGTESDAMGGETMGVPR